MPYSLLTTWGESVHTNSFHSTPHILCFIVTFVNWYLCPRYINSVSGISSYPISFECQDPVQISSYPHITISFPYKSGSINESNHWLTDIVDSPFKDSDQKFAVIFSLLKSIFLQIFSHRIFITDSNLGRGFASLLEYLTHSFPLSSQQINITSFSTALSSSQYPNGSDT